MATITTCDRCGEQIDRAQHRVLELGWRGRGAEIAEWDICERCADQLRYFMAHSPPDDPTDVL